MRKSITDWKHFKGFLIGVMFLAVLISIVGWRYNELTIYKLVVHEITKAREDSNIKITANVVYDGGGVVIPWDVIESGTSVAPHVLTAISQDWQLIDKADGIEELAITLPLITPALDGKVFHFKQFDSDTTAAKISTAGAKDAIESTQGTLTGTYDDTVDAQGDIKAWKAYYTSGTSDYWLLVLEDRS